MMPKTPILFLHLIGLCLAIGPVLIMDLRLFRLLLGNPVRRTDIDLAAFLAPWVRAGLLLLWVSGAGFLLHYAFNTPEALSNPKLHAKLLVVAILTSNGMLVERYAFVQLTVREGLPLLDPADRRQRLALLTIGAVSAMSWYTPLLLGVVRELNFACEAWILLSLYALSTAFLFFGLWVITHFGCRTWVVGRLAG